MEAYLPAGITPMVTSPGEMDLQFPTPAARAAYLLAVEADPEADRSGDVELTGYFVEHWLPELGGDLMAFIILLRHLAGRARRAGRPAVFVLPELARRLKRSRATVATYIRALTHPDDPECQDRRWQALRLYVRVSEPESYRGAGSAPWEFWVLRTDVLHPDHQERYTHNCRAFGSGQRAFPLVESPAGAEGEPVSLQTSTPSSLQILEAYSSQNLEACLTPALTPVSAATVTLDGAPTAPVSLQNSTPSSLQNLEAYPPSPPHPPPHPRACMQHAALQTQQGTEEGDSAPEPSLEEAAAALRSAGIPDPVARKLVRLSPRAPQRALTWARIYPATKRRMASKGRPIQSDFAYLRRHMAGECDCTAPDCDPTEEYLAEQRDLARRSRAPGRSAPAGRASGPVLADTLTGHWPALIQRLEAEDPVLVGFLADTARVTVEGDCLVVEAGPTVAAGIRDRKRAILDAARVLGLTFTTVRCPAAPAAATRKGETP